jgi:hypothetical protein
MTQTYCRWFGIGRKSLPGRAGPPCRRLAVPVLGDRLECRALLSVVNLTANVSPTVLRQINPMNQPHSVQVAVIRPVTLAGYVTETTGVTPAVSFRVADTSGRHMPLGTIKPQIVQAMTPGPPNLFFFSMRFGLNRSHLPGNGNGRQYTVFVTAMDPDNTSTIAIPVGTPQHRR